MVSQTRAMPGAVKEYEAIHGKTLPSLDTIPEWQHGIISHDVGILNSIADDIVQVVDVQVRSQFKALADVGSMLLEARAFFKGDKEFGQWRQTCTPIQAQKQAHQMMQLATARDNKLMSEEALSELPPSSIQQLMAAPPAIIKEIEARIEAGEKVTRQEIIDAKQDSGDQPFDVGRDGDKSPASSGGQKPLDDKDLTDVIEVQRKHKGPSMDSIIQGIISHPNVEVRIDDAMGELLESVDDITKAACILGLDPAPSYAPSIDIVLLAYDAAKAKLGDEDVDKDRNRYLNQAYTNISTHYKSIALEIQTKK